MKYMGSKARIAKDILPIILKDRQTEQWYVEPFAGGMNMIDKVNGNRIANDIHPHLIALFEAIVYENWKPIKISKNFYEKIKNNKGSFDTFLVGWAGFGCSYSGKYFAGYAGETNTKIGTVRDYQDETIRSILIQRDLLLGVNFTSMPYYEMIIPENSIIYCDPPYKGTTRYSNEFDHDKFFDWARVMSDQGHNVFISEYDAPADFVCVWEK